WHGRCYVIQDSVERGRARRVRRAGDAVSHSQEPALSRIGPVSAFTRGYAGLPDHDVAIEIRNDVLVIVERAHKPNVGAARRIRTGDRAPGGRGSVRAGCNPSQDL